MAEARVDSAKDLFDKLYEHGQQIDRLNTLLNKKLSGKCSVREPATTLFRLNENVEKLEAQIAPELAALKKHNIHLAKTIEMVKATIKNKKEILSKIETNIKKYTVADELGTENVCKELKSEGKARHAVVTASMKKKPAGPNSKKPLQNIENTQVLVDSDCPEEDKEEQVVDRKANSAPSTPVRSKSPIEELATPRLADYLSLDTMYEILDATNLITKSSKKSSSKKTPSNAHSMLTRGSTSKSRRALLQATPGNKTLPQDSPMSTPVMPELSKVKKPPFFDIPLPKPDFTGRIAMIDVEEYHSQVDEYIKGLVSLELINKVINSVDLMCKLNPETPVRKDELMQIIKPMAGPKAKLCLSILETFKRLKPLSREKDLMIAVLGRPS